MNRLPRHHPRRRHRQRPGPQHRRGTPTCSAARPSSTRTWRRAPSTTRSSRSAAATSSVCTSTWTRAEAAFDERSPGLDHVSFGCSDRAELENWASRLDELGVTHGEVVDAHYGSGLSFRDPDGIALEFFAPPAA